MTPLLRRKPRLHVLELSRLNSLARLPAVIAYRANPLTFFMRARLLTIKYASLVNLMHDKMVVPEYLQEKLYAGKPCGRHQ